MKSKFKFRMKSKNVTVYSLLDLIFLIYAVRAQSTFLIILAVIFALVIVYNFTKSQQD